MKTESRTSSSLQDLALLRKELPTIQRHIDQKSVQKMVLKKEFLAIVAENNRRLVTRKKNARC
jgi:hypothetical protein